VKTTRTAKAMKSMDCVKRMVRDIFGEWGWGVSWRSSVGSVGGRMELGIANGHQEEVGFLRVIYGYKPAKCPVKRLGMVQMNDAHTLPKEPSLWYRVPANINFDFSRPHFSQDCGCKLASYSVCGSTHLTDAIEHGRRRTNVESPTRAQSRFLVNHWKAETIIASVSGCCLHRRTILDFYGHAPN